jgi:hypothetical protein
MKFDIISFSIGLAVAIIISLMYTTFVAKKSFYEGSIFTDAMSIEDAQKLLNNETETMAINYQEKDQKGLVTEDVKKQYQDDLIKVTSDFNSFMTKKSFENVGQTEEFASPAPAPAPVPQDVAPPSPQTSTYEIEPYHG